VTITSEHAREILQLGSQRLGYRSTGNEHTSTVVLLHGWGANLDAVAPIQAALADDHRVVSFDLPGFGQSGPPPGAWSSSDYADLVKQALDRLHVRQASLIGHSFGGKISIGLATRWPGLVHRLVLVNSAGIRPNRSPLQKARIATFKTARRLAGQGVLRDWLVRRFGSADYRKAGPLRPTLVRVVNEDLRSLLPRIAAPTLLIWGDQDRETPPSDAAIMERLIPDAGLVIFPGAGHYSYADDLPRFCRVVGNFLKTSDIGRGTAGV
jgi:pimeloyl-ACP methyl ester carboxylesterase